MKVADRILTIVVTATLTSAVWIVAGGSFFRHASDEASSHGDAGGSAQVLPSVQTDSLPQSGSSSVADAGGAPVAAARSNSGRNASENLIIPVMDVAAADLTDSFHDERGGGDHQHEAIDIMAPAGTGVIAAAPGTVEKLFRSKAGGNTIYIRSPDRRLIYYYAHLKTYAANLAEGQQVRRGDRLGQVGSSGDASADAPHLHFAVLRTTPDADWWQPANAIDPRPLLTGRSTPGR